MHTEDHDHDFDDSHIGTPLRNDAFEKTDEQKIEIIQEHFKAIMETLGLDLFKWDAQTRRKNVC